MYNVINLSVVFFAFSAVMISVAGIV